MKTTDPLRTLRFQVRALWCAVLVLTGVAAAANVRPLHVSNADNTPDTDVSLSSAHWTGTLDPARVPGTLQLTTLLGANFRGTRTLAIAADELDITGGEQDAPAAQFFSSGALGVGSEVYCGGYGQFVTGLYVGTTAVQPVVDGSGNFYYPNGAALADSNGNLYGGGNQIADASGNLYAGGNLVADTIGNLYAPQNIYGSGNVEAYGFFFADDGSALVAQGGKLTWVDGGGTAHVLVCQP